LLSTHLRKLHQKLTIRDFSFMFFRAHSWNPSAHKPLAPVWSCGSRSGILAFDFNCAHRPGIWHLRHRYGKDRSGRHSRGRQRPCQEPRRKMIASALTDSHGRFQLQPLQPGTYIVEVELHRNETTSSKTVDLREEKTVEFELCN